LACQDEFFVNNPLDVKENDEHALDFALHLSPFSACPELSMPFKHQCMVQVLFSEHLFNHWQGLCHTFSKICTKFDEHSLSDPSQN
jgi:hypothetical protein